MSDIQITVSKRVYLIAEAVVHGEELDGDAAAVLAEAIINGVRDDPYERTMERAILRNVQAQACSHETRLLAQIPDWRIRELLADLAKPG